MLFSPRRSREIMNGGNDDGGGGGGRNPIRKQLYIRAASRPASPGDVFRAKSRALLVISPQPNLPLLLAAPPLIVNAVI